MTAQLPQYDYDMLYSPYAWWILAGRNLFGSVLVAGILPDDDMRILEKTASRFRSVNMDFFYTDSAEYHDAIIIHSAGILRNNSPEKLLRACKKMLTASGVLVMYITDYPVYHHGLRRYPDNTDILPCISYHNLPFEAFVPGRYHSNKNQCVTKDRIKTRLYNLGAYRFLLDSSILISKASCSSRTFLDDMIDELCKNIPDSPEFNDIRLSKYYFRYGKLIASFECKNPEGISRYVVIIATDKMALIQRENEKSAILYIKNNESLAGYAVDFYQETTVSGFRAYIMDEAEGITVDASCASLHTMTLNASRIIEYIAEATINYGRDITALQSKLTGYINEFNCKMSRYGARIEYPCAQVIDVLIRIPSVFMHGDMKLENFVLNTNNDVNKIIDWEQADTDGWLLLDLLYLISYDMHIADKIDFIASFHKLYNDDISSSYKEMLQSYRNRFGVSDYQYRILLCIFFIHHYACRVTVEFMTEQENLRYRKCIAIVKTILHGD